jgi:predicted NBD/HSP70 family sugar kinase
MRVHVDNISRTLTYGEIFYGWGKKYKDFAYVMIDFGVSGNMVQNSKIVKGKNNVAGEYGHVSIDPFRGKACYCGNKGCIESYISERGIVRAVQDGQGGNKNSLVFQVAAKRRESVSFSLVKEALSAKDPFVENIFIEAAQTLGYFLVNMVNLTNPPVIILGGSVVDAFPQMVEIAGAFIKEGVFSNKARKTEVLLSLLSREKLYLGTTTRVILNALNRYAAKK